MKRNKLILLGLLSLFVLAGCKTGGNSTSNKASSTQSTTSSIVNSSGSNKQSTSNVPSSSSQKDDYSSVTSSSSQKDDSSTPTVVPNPTQRIYLIGAAVWGWSNYAELTLKTDNIYYGTFDLKTTTEGFVITSQTNYDEYVFKTPSDSNITVNKYGTYNVYFTYDVTKTDSSWTKAKEKNNAVDGYYKIELESAVNIPIDEEMVYVSGAALYGWGTYMPMFLDEETGIYSYIYGFSANTQGFIFTSEEDNEHDVYHHEDGSNITVTYAGDYKIMFTYNDMSNDDTWTIVKEQNGNADAYYKLVPQFEIPDNGENPGGGTENPSGGTNTPANQLYIFGGATGSWTNAITLPEVSTGLYKAELNITNSGEGFVICELNVLSDKSGFCLHDENGDNFKVSYSGLYELSVTWDDMSGDNTWKVAKEVNANAKGDAYYKLVPLFNINDTTAPATIEKIYINGGNVGGWESYVELTKVSDTLFQGEMNLSTSTDGFVVTAQKSRGASDIVFKNVDEKNLNIDESGRYTISFSLVEQDDTWIEIVDCKGNYENSCYIKLEKKVETRTNVALNGNASASASSVNGTKTADKVFDGESSDTKRWESTQGVDPQWIEVDLGATFSVNSIEIQWYGAASAKEYTISISVDGEDWTVLENVNNADGTRNRLDTFEFESTSIRFIRINGTSRVATYGYSIGELYVWGV